MSIILEGVTLPQGLAWENEFTQEKVSQNMQRTLQGNAVVYYGQRQNGFPISLSSGTDHSWCKRSVVESIKALADEAGKEMSLTLRGVTYPRVIFDHSSGKGFEAVPVIPLATPDGNSYYRIKLNLIVL